jgi:hypothetical protein
LVSAAETAAADFAHVRSDNASMRALLDDGYKRSQTFRALVDEIDALPGIVYVAEARLLSRGMEGALLHMVAGSRDMVILRVLIKTNLAGDYAVAILAHELQHVAETLRSGGTANGDAMTALFASIDTQEHSSKFETEEARAVTARVLRELRHATRH